jgi:Membrane proteins related to metalloendopeptidases
MNKFFLQKHTLLITLFAILLPLVGQAQNTTTTSTEPEKKSVPVIENESSLVADKAKRNPTEALTIESDLMDFTVEMENYLYPADELYHGMWNNEYVKAYNLELPDSLAIDVSEFVIPHEGYVTSKYGPRKRRFHHGIDLGIQMGDTIRAAFDGKVRVKKYERRGYGYYLVLRHSNGLETVYGHLSKFLVDVETVVKAGEPIGLGGSTGRSSGPHLHLEFRLLGQSINPSEIVDFDQKCTYDDVFVFDKRKVNPKARTYAHAPSTKITKNKNNRSSKKAETASKSEKKKATKNTNARYHRVKDGDTLGAIARRYGTTVNKVCKLNNIKSTTTLKIGKSIRIS